jgi:hypothetical protein
VGAGVLNETRVAGKTTAILLPENFFGKRRYRCDRCVIMQPGADHWLNRFGPVIVIGLRISN